MTSVEELETPPAETFETAYAADRGTLYRALVLATGNRDIAVEAVDRAFARWQTRRPSQRVDAELHVFAAAYSWASRKLRKPSRMLQGFRLQEDEDGSDDRLLQHFEDLDLMDRSLLTCLHYLDWNANRTAVAMKIPPGEALPRAGAAESRLGRSAGLATNAASARLGDALRRRADTYPEPIQRMEAVRSQAKWRRIGRFSLGTVGALVLAAGVAFGIQQLSDGSGTTETGPSAAGGQNGTTPGTSDGGIFSAETLEWERVPMAIRQGDLSSVAYGPAGFVAIGQDWSQGNGRSIAMTSEDGVFWEPAPGPTEGPNSWIHQMVIAGDKYVAIGSSFDEVRGGDTPIVAVSADGTTWSTIVLPVEPQIELNGQLVNLHTWVQSVAASGDRVLVLASQNAEFDSEFFLEDALGDDVSLDFGWGWSDRGLEVYSSNGETAEVIPWEEVGIDQETVQFMTSGRPLILSSSDFTNWETIPFDGFGPNHWVNNLAVVGGSFAATVYGDFGPELWVSTDGTEWTKQEAFEAGISINAMASVGDRVIAVGSNTDGRSSAWVSTDLDTWEPIALPFEGGWLQQIQVSSAGIAVLGEANASPQGPVELVVGDLTVQASQNGGFTVLDAEGIEIAKIAGSDVNYSTDRTIELLDPETGDILATIDQRELDQAWELLWRQFEVERGGQGPSYVLLLSADGERWTSHVLADAIGGGFYPMAIAVGPDSVVMTGHQEGGFLGDVIGGDGGGVTVWVGTAP